MGAKKKIVAEVEDGIDELEIETQVIPKANSGVEPEGVRPTGKTLLHAFYKRFPGKCMTVGECKDLLPQFKQYYFERKREEIETSAMSIINDFGEKIAPLFFTPYPQQFKLWRANWDRTLMAERGMVLEERKHSAVIRKAIQTVDDAGNLLAPDEDTLEMGNRVLAGELLHDALKIIKAEDAERIMFDEDTRIKRKNYVLNITKNLQGSEALKLKRSAESRENANFLITLLRKAQAGLITVNDLKLMRGATSGKSEVAE